MTMNPSEILAVALAERVRQETTPIREAVAAVQVRCIEFEAVHSRGIERRVLGAMLRAAGTDVPGEDPEIEKATRSLLEALDGLRAYLAPAPLATPPGPAPGPPAPPPGAPPASPPPTGRARSADALANALEPLPPPEGDRLIGPPPEPMPVMGPIPEPDQCDLLGSVHIVAAPLHVEAVSFDEAMAGLAAQEEQPVNSGVIEIPKPEPEPEEEKTEPANEPCFAEQLAARDSGVYARQYNADPADVKLAQEIYLQAHQIDFVYDHPTRIVHVMQVCAAQCRSVMERLPQNSAAYNDMVKTLKFLTAKKTMHNITPFVVGLTLKHDQDWDRVARTAIDDLQKYDRDAETGIGGKSGSKTQKKDRQGQPSTNFSWPELPRLRKLIAEGSEVIMVGGETDNAKVRLLKDRFGVDITWYGTDEKGSHKAEDVVRRIRGGGICAVIVINGWMRHHAYNSIVRACSGMKIAYATAEKGGTGCIGSALDKIEDALARLAA